MLIACNKTDNSKTIEDEFKSLEADFELKGDGDYEKIIACRNFWRQSNIGYS